MLKKRATVVRLLSVIVLIGWMMYAVYKVPDFQNCLGEYQETYKNAEKVDEYPSGPLGFLINARHDTICTFVLIDEHHDGVIAVATIFIALFTLTLWLSTDKLWMAAEEGAKDTKAAVAAAERANEISREAMIAARRALLTIEHVRLMPTHRIHGSGDSVSVCLGLDIHNIGETPATGVEIHCKGICLLPTMQEVGYYANIESAFKAELRSYPPQMGTIASAHSQDTITHLWRQDCSGRIQTSDDGVRFASLCILVGVSYCIIGDKHRHVTFDRFQAHIEVDALSNFPVELQRQFMLSGEVD